MSWAVTVVAKAVTKRPLKSMVVTKRTRRQLWAFEDEGVRTRRGEELAANND
jgi:hypothetical protein